VVRRPGLWRAGRPPELLRALRAALARAPRRGSPASMDFPLAGGLVGYAAYDIVRYFEKLPRRVNRGSPVPDLLRRAAVAAGVRSPDARHRAAARRVRRPSASRCARGDRPRCAAGSRPAGRGGYSPASASISAAQFLANVGRTKEYIAAGDVYQLVLSVRFSGRTDLDPFEAYRALRLLNPSPYMYYCELGTSRSSAPRPRRS
jgi:anthranilate synthase component I